MQVKKKKISKGVKKTMKLNTEIIKSRKYANDSEGALNPNYYVKAQMRTGTWHLGKIIECKLIAGFVDNGSVKKTDNSYDYYIHYEEFDRRMDEWVNRKKIIPTNQFIEGDVPKKGEKGVHEDDEHEGLDHQSRLFHEEATKQKTISSIHFGQHKTETWYYSPYPEPYHDIDTQFICEFCQAFYVSDDELKAHEQKCDLTHPPGNEIYRDTTRNLAFFEIDGYKNYTYCENLCYLSKLFLDHKLLMYTIEPFLFYVLCEVDEKGAHIVGYFSKNKDFSEGNNLSCILTLPFQQRKGYGKQQISLSYELSIIEGKVGSPERPLSDQGRLSYLSWWTQRIIDYIKNEAKENYSIDDISKDTGIKTSDIIDSLERVKLIKKHGNQSYICTDTNILDNVYKSMGRPSIEIDISKLHWWPFKIRYYDQESMSQK